MPLLSYFQSQYPEAGCDEAGRGCLAGPVMAAAVVLPRDYFHPQLTDSKLLSEKLRYRLREEIMCDAISYCVASISHGQIDEINILQASILAMHRALDGLRTEVGFVIIDGHYFRPYRDLPHQTIVKGDSLYFSIAAASVLAKTSRDEWMIAAHEQYPHYNWIKNKGYATADHRAAILNLGLSPLHRRSFHLKEMQGSMF